MHILVTERKMYIVKTYSLFSCKESFAQDSWQQMINGVITDKHVIQGSKLSFRFIWFVILLEFCQTNNLKTGHVKLSLYTRIQGTISIFSQLNWKLYILHVLSAHYNTFLTDVTPADFKSSLANFPSLLVIKQTSVSSGSKELLSGLENTDNEII